ncbi:hypothetical protein J4H92_05250 [Leucobacter weissii]|uniref:Integral membrane protein n=1 Tax=Leucobacter weissii TaxID=1983706 RepID=A0A939MM67_9MICO|nr:hypothetical protein [Leucobacter weissii]MBO1901352.1 hypothetical protein [Leucobacter weissii]
MDGAPKPQDPLPLSRSMSTEEGVYGLILVAGLVAASGAARASALQTLVFVGITVLVFWAAHVYAGTVAEHGSAGTDREPVGLRRAIRRAMRRSRGLLIATLFPAAPLLLGAIGALGDRLSIWVSLWVSVGMLAMLGYLAYLRKGASLHQRLLGAAATASFGIVIIVAKAIVTH